MRRSSPPLSEPTTQITSNAAAECSQRTYSSAADFVETLKTGAFGYGRCNGMPLEGRHDHCTCKICALSSNIVNHVNIIRSDLIALMNVVHPRVHESLESENKRRKFEPLPRNSARESQSLFSQDSEHVFDVVADD
ncbi:hypothetical protein EMPS_06775 [Entomortierella parvispora]|uniref:Uncharacterized protein n=1 Tax=Entomortierella parvispora TaxID=205924 RepID=A0A9P3HDL7_9FUNG|nr:hypothetical protein EMPS_06775 [Entomortierella parvispora]